MANDILEEVRKQREAARKATAEYRAPSPVVVPAPVAPSKEEAKPKEPTRKEQARTYLETGKVYDPYSKTYVEPAKPPTVEEAVEAAPKPIVTTVPSVAISPKIPKDIYAPTMEVGIRTISPKELEEITKTWEEPAKITEPGGPEQFAISAISYPAETAAGLVETGLWAVSKPKELPKKIKESYIEFGKGLWAGKPRAWGGLTGAVVWTGVAPKLIEKYTAPPTPTETAFVSRAKITGPRGEQISYFKTKAGKVEYPSVGFTKYIAEGKRTYGVSTILTVTPEEQIKPSVLLTKGVTLPEKFGYTPFVEKGLLITKREGILGKIKPYKKLDTGAIGVSKPVSYMENTIASVGKSISKKHRGVFAGLTKIEMEAGLEALPGSTYYATAPPSYMRAPTLIGASEALAKVKAPTMPPLVMPSLISKEQRAYKEPKLKISPEPTKLKPEKRVEPSSTLFTPFYEVRKKPKLRSVYESMQKSMSRLSSPMTKVTVPKSALIPPITTPKLIRKLEAPTMAPPIQQAVPKLTLAPPTSAVVPPAYPAVAWGFSFIWPSGYRISRPKLVKKAKAPPRYRPSLGGIATGKLIKAVPKMRMTGLEVRYPVARKGGALNLMKFSPLKARKKRKVKKRKKRKGKKKKR